jgi:hypothetical protein
LRESLPIYNCLKCKIGIPAHYSKPAALKALSI